MSLAASIISSTLNAGTPLLIAAVGIIIHEKSGVLNLGIEGIMLMGAVSGFAVTHATGSFELGFLAGMGVGLLLGLLFAFFTIGLRANQYAAGLALTLFGTGLSAFLGQSLQGAALPGRAPLGIPGLEGIPFLGEAFFSQHWLAYAALAMIAGVWYFLFKSRPGLILRAVGESPESAFSLGYPVRLIRFWAVLFGAMMAGLAGAYLSLVYTPLWVEGMVAGRGWIALALVTFATWRPARARRRLPLRRRHDASVRGSGHGHRHRAAVHGHDAVHRDDSRAGSHQPQSRLDPPQRARLARQAVRAAQLRISPGEKVGMSCLLG